MNYQKQGFHSGGDLYASQLEAMEDGIINAERFAMEGAAGAANMEKGAGEGASQQTPDISRVTNGKWDFGNRNPNAEADNEEFAGEQDYGAIGIYSATFGGSNRASGPRSFAVNNRTIAAGDESMAQGYCSVAAGASSFAGGSTTYAKGEAAVSLGLQTQANGNYSYAGGAKTQANGELSQATGINTIANSYASNASGINTKAYGNASCAEGYDCITGKLISVNIYQFEGDGTATGVGPNFRFSTPGTDTTPGSSSRVYKPITVNSISVEYNITNSGTALADSSTTKYMLKILGALEGTGSANQLYYHIPEIIDDGQWHTLTIDLNSTFSGGSNENLPMNVSSFDDINDIVCCIIFSFGVDFNGTAIFKEPIGISADETITPIPLEQGKIQHIASWSQIDEDTIIHPGGNYAQAHGVRTTASGDASHAEGMDTIASGFYSHAAGKGTIADKIAQTVVGMYNAPSRDGSLFAVGVGADDSSKFRRTGLEVVQGGEIIILWENNYYSLNLMLNLISNAHGGPAFFDEAKKK